MTQDPVEGVAAGFLALQEASPSLPSAVAFAAMGARFGKDFPAQPRPVSLAMAQSLLTPAEALLLFRVETDGIRLYAVRSDRAAAWRLGVDRVSLRQRVARLRDGLDLTDDGDIPPFPVAAAHGLYRDLLAPAAMLLADARHLILVPDGPLWGLPFDALLTEPPAGPVATMTGQPWLVRRYAVSLLPAVSALQALRQGAGRSQAEKAFLGIGDPLLANHPVRPPSDDEKHQDRPIWHHLPALPDTAEEVTDIAAVVGGGPEDVLLRDQAHEADVRRQLAVPRRLIVFATHGLSKGDIPTAHEDALVLTPPDGVAAADDDGLLTASEIAALTLDADWVVLSAGSFGGNPLGGIVEAALRTGTRTVLAPASPLVSDTAGRLTTGTFAALAAEPGLGRAAALQRSMNVLMDDPKYAHPLYWASFVIVGEGG